MTKNGFAEYVIDLLTPLGNIKSRKMFGGVGFYKDGIFFALIADEILYFKVDDATRFKYELYGSKPFSYEGKNNKTIVMSYWEVPADILENPDNLSEWVQHAVEAARRAKKN